MYFPLIYTHEIVCILQATEIQSQVNEVCRHPFMQNSLKVLLKSCEILCFFYMTVQIVDSNNSFLAQVKIDEIKDVDRAGSCY